MNNPSISAGPDVNGLPPVLQDLQALQNELIATRLQLETLRFTVAHDLRAPLRHIRAFVQVIEEDHAATLVAPVRAHLKTIQDSANKAVRMLDELLEASKSHPRA
jgi:light-regulated signal transduction histidine kinase (bacteriophytochrome)